MGSILGPLFFLAAAKMHMFAARARPRKPTRLTSRSWRWKIFIRPQAPLYSIQPKLRCNAVRCMQAQVVVDHPERCEVALDARHWVAHGLWNDVTHAEHIIGLMADRCLRCTDSSVDTLRFDTPNPKAPSM